MYIYYNTKYFTCCIYSMKTTFPAEIILLWFPLFKYFGTLKDA